jgi:hypothetical protein
MRDHLRFVISNWHLSDFAFRKEKKSSLKYIVTAFAVTETNDTNELFEGKVHHEISSLFNAVRENGKTNVSKQEEIES